MKKFILCLLILSFIIPVYSIDSYALTKEQQKKIQEGKNRQKDIEKRIQELRKRKKVVTSQMYVTSENKKQIEEKLDVTEVKLNDLAYRYKLAQKQVEGANQSLEKAKENYNSQLKYAQIRLRHMYKYKKIDYMNFLLDAKDLNNFMRRVEYFNYVAKRDSELLEKLQEKKEEVDLLRKQYIKKREDIAQVEKDYAKEKNEYEAQKDTLANIMVQLKNDKSTVEKEEAALARESQRITTMLQQMLSSGPVRPRMGTGRLSWPVPSCSSISSPYGWRIHPISGTSKFHTGIDIPAGYGSAIIAPDNGVVISAGWMGGYGQAIIIDHGGGIATLFGHCSVLYAGNGQTVRKGQTIAAVGSTGYSTGPHLHFEVRQNGNPVNPMSWM